MITRLKKEEARELLRRYRLGECTQSELEIIDRWYHSFDPEADKEMAILPADDLNRLREEMLDNINREIDHAEEDLTNKEFEEPVRKIRSLTFENLTKIAAVLLVGTGFFIFFLGQSDNIIEKSKALTEKVETKKASPSTIYLSDGSVVWLKGKSQLKYPETFQGTTREVTLIGEAFFDVAKDPEKPFIIRSAHFTTRVLGTSFNIKAYEKDESQEVVVVTGKVVVSVNEASGDKIKELVLKPNQKAIYSRKDNSLVESDAAEHEIYSPLTECKLIFDETSLENIIKVLNARYDVNISLEEENMKNCLITADLTKETLEVSIAILSKAINARYTIDGKNIIMRGDGCPASP